MSNLRDDWLALNCNASEEGDPILHCYFKTELTANLLTLTQASISVLIGPSIEYAKKKDKKAQIQFIRDEKIAKDDVYKSHAVHVPSGEPPSSTSRPAARRKPGIVRPITQGKLLRAGGPSDKGKTSRPKPAVQPLPGKSAQFAAVRPTPVAPPTRNSVPPPPPPPKEPEAEVYKAKFAFEGQEGEISLKKDDTVELVEKDDNGWWLVRKDGQEGWAPNNYLELVPPKPKAAPAARSPPPRPPPPPSVPLAVVAAPIPASATNPTVLAMSVKSLAADASAKPVAVFPGLAPSNGSAAPWKKPTAVSANGSLSTTPASSRPSSSLGVKPPPPVATKPKPVPPPVASKPSGSKPPPKPPIPTASRPGASTAPPKISKLSAPAGQMDLAAALAKRAQKIADE